VEYGKNLLDVKISRDHTDRISVLLPLGAKIKDVDAEGHEYETDERVQITSVNGGKNYIVDDDAAAEIGMIWRTEIWDDVTVPGNLLTKARTRLHDLAQGVTSMELTIVDESDTGADIGDIHAGMYVVCKSPPHGIDGRYRCVGRTRDYLNPAGNTITIGASGVTLGAFDVPGGIGVHHNVSAHPAHDGIAAMHDAAFHQQFIELLRRRGHVLITLTERHDGKAHALQILRHLHRTPSVESDLEDVVLRTQVLDKLLDEIVR